MNGPLDRRLIVLERAPDTVGVDFRGSPPSRRRTPTPPIGGPE